MLTIVPLAFALTLIPTGIILLIVGFRGRRVDDHPRCRTCQYDLTGKPETSPRCPECGHDLTTPGAITDGLRQRRPRLLAAGGLLVFLPFLVVAGLLTDLVREFNPYPYYPNGWLVSDLGSTSVKRRTAAAQELLWRVIPSGRGSAMPFPSNLAVSPERLPEAAGPPWTDIADRLLARQADRSRVWYSEQGDVLDLLFNQNLLDRPRLVRYADNAVSLRLMVRPRVRQGDPIVVRVVPSARVGTTTVFYLKTFGPHYAVPPPVGPDKLDLTRLPDPSGYHGTALRAAGGGYSIQTCPPLPGSPGTATLSPGKHTLSFVRPWALSVRGGGFAPFKAPPLTRGVFTHTADVEILPAGTTDDLTPVRYADLDAVIVRSIRSAAITFHTAARTADIYFDLSSPPEDLAFDVFLDLPAGEGITRPFPIGAITSAANVGLNDAKFVRDLPATLPATVDVLFVPSPTAARNTIDLYRYADVTLRLKNVPVTVEP